MTGFFLIVASKRLHWRGDALNRRLMFSAFHASFAPFLALLGLLVCGCTPRPDASGDYRDFQVDQEELTDYVEQLTAHGFSGAVLVMQSGQPFLSRGYGLADEASGSEVTDQTLFYLASVSKQFTAAAIVKLVEQGRLRVENALGDFFPQAPPDKTGITVHQLLTHTSGLVEYVGGVRDSVGRNEALATVLSEPLRFAPGAEYGYSNGAYALLAMIAEEVSGLPFADYMRREIFEPADMSHTFLLGEAVPNGLSTAHGYSDGEDNGDFSAWSGPAWAHWGSGGVFSNLRDMARWERALNEDVVLSAASRDLLFTPYVEARQAHYAYGWRIGNTDYAGPVIYHYGSEDVGMGAAYMRFTDSRATIIVLSNRAADGLDLATHSAVAIAHKLLEPGYDGLPRYAR